MEMTGCGTPHPPSTCGAVCMDGVEAYLVFAHLAPDETRCYARRCGPPPCFTFDAARVTPAMQVCSSQVANETNNLCAYMPTEAECVSFPLLSPSECAPLRRCADACSGAAPCECEDGTLPNYTCRWLNATADTVTATLAPESYQRVNRIGPRCVKAECPLYRYARGVALEFGVLFLILCYVSTFALHDVSRLLARPPSAERMSLSVIQTTHSRPALIPLRDSMSASGAASTMVAPLDARLITGHHVSEEAVVGSAETVVRIAYPSAPLAR